ncbi:hypothetical protein [Nocardia asiatica]|uniref:hypothetical protein n=1 Tax=Nocardia asiatica TaxID=209252 RepID=UPI0024570876|nr:hypothetical protein [Nocardia asiatica]
MTETAGLSAFHPSSEELRQRRTHQYATSAPAMTAFAFIAVAAYAAFATFGIEWARLAGASAWEAAVWPVAVTAVTIQALYCRVRMTPGWYPNWARWLFEAVAGAGVLLAGCGNGLHSGGHPHQLSDAVSVLVAAVPGFCLMVSIFVAGTFMLAVPPPMPNAAPVLRELKPRSGETARDEFDLPDVSTNS